jgi:hypothetical protein
MPNNTLAAAALAGSGAFTKFIMDGIWTRKAAIISLGGSVAGFMLAMALVDLVPPPYDHSFWIRGAIIFFCGLLSAPVMQRLNRVDFKARFLGIEMESKGEDE